MLYIIFLRVIFTIQVISFLLASGVGVGFSLSVELKDYVDSLVDFLENLITNGIIVSSIDELEEYRSKSKKFLKREIIATGILAGGFATMAILSILTSLKKSGKSLFG